MSSIQNLTAKEIIEQIYQLARNKNYSAIVAGGEFPQNHHLHQLIKLAKIIIACDGVATQNLLYHGMNPDYIIGDGDSLTQVIKDKFANKIILASEQNSNDLTKAINFVVNHKYAPNTIIFAATGLREDHTLANISLLEEYLGKFQAVTLISDYGIFTVHNGFAELNTIPTQQISFFTPDSHTMVTCTELKWPLQMYKFKKMNSGTLNEATADKITVISNGVVIIYRAFQLGHNFE